MLNDLSSPAFNAFTSVSGILLHAGGFEILSIDEIAKRGGLTISETAVAIMQLDEQGALTIGRLDGKPVYRLSSSGVNYLTAALEETPRVWR